MAFGDKRTLETTGRWACKKPKKCFWLKVRDCDNSGRSSNLWVKGKKFCGWSDEISEKEEICGFTGSHKCTLNYASRWPPVASFARLPRWERLQTTQACIVISFLKRRTFRFATIVATVFPNRTRLGDLKEIFYFLTTRRSIEINSLFFQMEKEIIRDRIVFDCVSLFLWVSRLPFTSFSTTRRSDRISKSQVDGRLRLCASNAHDTHDCTCRFSQVV